MNRSPVKRLWAIVLMSVALAACGGSGAADDVLAETVENLDEIRSGTLTMRLVVTPTLRRRRCAP